jgi:hypothetical protein
VSDLSKALSNRLEALVRPPQRGERILSTTGTRAAIAALDARTEALEEAVRRLTETVQAIADAQDQSNV